MISITLLTPVNTPNYAYDSELYYGEGEFVFILEKWSN